MALYGDATKTDGFGAAFQPELMTKFWQHSATRMMRANELVLHGLMNAATREMELAQELALYNLSRFRRLSKGAATEALGSAETQANAQEFQQIMSGLREVSEALWKTFGDASKLLIDGGAEPARETFADPLKHAAEQPGATIERVPGP